MAVGRLAQVLLIGVVLLLGGCAGHQVQDRIDDRLRAGDTSGALEVVERLDSRRNQALYLLNRGMLLRMDGQLDASVEAFEDAKRQLGALEPISISETVADWALAETAGQYDSNVHERLFLHVTQMLNFLELGDLHAARVEALQIDLGLRRVDPSGGAAPHGGDAFARYLSGIVFEASGDRSDALIAYRRAAQRYEALEAPVPRDLQVSLLHMLDALDQTEERERWAERFGIEAVRARGEGTGQLVVVVHSGLGPRLGESSVAAQDPRSGQLYRVSLPAVRGRGDPSAAVTLAVAERAVEGERVESVHHALERWVGAQIPLLTARAVSRNVVRHQVTGQVRDESRGLGALLNVLGFLVDSADTRTWRTLPDSLWMSRAELAPGTYEPKLHIRRRAGGEQTIQLQEPVEILEGGLTVRSVFVR
ncbi:hypothetical protein [Aquisalimonas sp.]|uniref:hypothetical protein n=1 Tax=Aquisalimonas sp. TaxID=1872621 RepID=UPI0025BE98FC|nr:hypothetical protein [Aquisalimonas sp.]